MTKLPSVATLTRRSIQLQSRTLKLTEQYTELFPRYKLALRDYDVADQESEELFVASRQLESVPFWDEMKRDLLNEAERVWKLTSALGDRVDKLEMKLLTIETSIYDSNVTLNIGRC